MKRMLLLSALLSAAIACGTPSIDPVSSDPSVEPSAEPSVEPVSEDPSEEPESSDPKVLVLAAPTDLQLTEAGEGIQLTWTDNSTMEEGYLVEKKAKTKNEKFFLPPDSESWQDENVEVGSWTYEVKSYKGLQRSEAASVTYEKRGKPSLNVSLQTSHYMASVRVDVVSDGGLGCTGGVCWGPTEDPTIEDDNYQYPNTLRSGASFYANIRGLNQGKQYYARAWVKSGEDIVYSNSLSIRLPYGPSPYTVDWTPVDASGLPSSVGLYKATSSVTGHSVNMWYAVADLSGGDLEVLTTCNASSLKTLTSFVQSNLSDEKVYVVINGGYFASPGSSYSYIVERGVEKARNISSLTRTESYNVTRGVFALDRENRPFIGWLYSGTSTWAYSQPLPTWDGGPRISPSEDFPCHIEEGWAPYAAMGGGPVLVKDERICFDFLKSSEGKYLSNCELFQTDIYGDTLRAPRTAIGYTADCKVVLFIADGRNSGGSAGLTLEEEARIMIGLGCTDVLNLDGGGSTMMTVGNAATLLNTPSDGQQRAVYSYVAIIGK